MMNNDGNPFAGYEPNAAAGQEDPGGDFSLAGAARRAARTGSVFGGSYQDTTTFPPPWPGLGLNPLGFRAETQHGTTSADATDPPLPEEEETGEQEAEDHSAELLRRVLAGNRENDISRVKLAKMPAPTGSRGLPLAKAWQDWFTIRLRTWANVISPEFEAELVKMVQGQQADLSRHDAADRQLAHEICFNIDDKMLPYLLGADLSSGCAILSVLHKEILASTAEHTAALHERFAKPVPCRDKMKLLLTLRQCLTDLKELQAAGSSPSKETLMQSLKTVTGGIRDLNNVHEITDLLAPNDPGKLNSAIERKAVGWAVMDADTRLSDSSAGAGKGAKGDHKGAYSAAIPCKHYAKGTCARGDKCRFSHKGPDKSSGKGGKGKKVNNERDRCKKCGKITNPPHRAKSCPEAVSAQAAMTPAPSSSSEATPPGLSVPVSNSANSESVQS